MDYLTVHYQGEKRFEVENRCCHPSWQHLRAQSSLRAEELLSFGPPHPQTSVHSIIHVHPLVFVPHDEAEWACC